MLKWELTLFLTISHIRYEILPKQLETYEKYCKIIQWGRANPTKFMEEFMNLEFLDHQKYIFLNAWVADVSVILASRSSGKALSLDTPVYSVKQNGPTTIGEIKVGDLIYNEKGLPTEVVHINPVIFDEYYEIEFDDGEIIKCNKDHLWTVYDSLREEKIPVKQRNLFTYTTEQLTSKIRKAGGAFRYAVPLNAPIQHKEKDFIIEPYLLGLWISDGKKDEPFITCEAKDIDEQLNILNSINKNGWIFTKRMRCETYGDIIISHKNDKYRKNGVRSYSVFLHKLRELGIYGNKHIPEEYYLGSINQRMELIQGLYDADGSCQKTGRAVFGQKSDVITNNVKKLLLTLGILYRETTRTYIDKRTNKQYASNTIYTNNDISVPFFKLTRKLNNQKNVKQSNFKKSIIDIRKVNKKIPMKCITVDNESGLFLCGNKYTITHNSYLATPFIMARSLLFPNHNSYLMAPSGQQSQMLFQKLEDLAKGQIASAIGVSSFFLDECVRMNSKADPFTHSKQSFTVELYNGSTINTLNSVAKNIVGIRFLVFS